MAMPLTLPATAALGGGGGGALKRPRSDQQDEEQEQLGGPPPRVPTYIPLAAAQAQAQAQGGAAGGAGGGGGVVEMELVPIRVDVDVGGHRIVDAFLMDPADARMGPEQASVMWGGVVWCRLCVCVLISSLHITNP